jgi:hypothetical protein
MPKPRLKTARRCQSLVPARCNKNGDSTASVPEIDKPAALQISRRPIAVDSCDEKNPRRWIHIVGKARKKVSVYGGPY